MVNDSESFRPITGRKLFYDIGNSIGITNIIKTLRGMRTAAAAGAKEEGSGGVRFVLNEIIIGR